MDQTGTPSPRLRVDSNPIHLPDIYAFVEPPTGVLDRPYILLSAFSDLPASLPLRIAGKIDQGADFTCPGTPCLLPLTTDSTVRFWAYVDTFHKSPENTVAVDIQTPAPGQYTVSTSPVVPDSPYTDSCAATWNTAGSGYPAWAQMPVTPSQLNTNQALFYLGGHLISSGMVDASTCGSGGLLGNSYPNACGMEKARAAITGWQNLFDLDIWLSSHAVGLPPRVLKALIMRESQFWPGNSHNNMPEYGLGQINDYGADVALRWDPALYQQVCQGILADCSLPYARAASPVQAMLRGSLISRVNAQCPDCRYGIDMDTAHTSVYVVARVLQANCRETGYILNSHHLRLQDYEDLWKFTLTAYHSGYYCLDYAISLAIAAGKPVNWSSISERLTCQGARKYVDDFWTALKDPGSPAIVRGEWTYAVLKPVPASVGK